MGFPQPNPYTPDNELSDFLEPGHIQMETSCGRTFLWKNVEIECVVSVASEAYSLGIGPKEEVISARIKVRKTNFFSADSSLITADSDVYTADDDRPQPVAGKKLSIDGKVYRVVTATCDGTKSFITLDLQSAEK